MSKRSRLPRLCFPVCLRKHLAKQPGFTALLMAAMLERLPCFCYGKRDKPIFTATRQTCLRFLRHLSSMTAGVWLAVVEKIEEEAQTSVNGHKIYIQEIKDQLQRDWDLHFILWTYCKRKKGKIVYILITCFWVHFLSFNVSGALENGISDWRFIQF